MSQDSSRLAVIAEFGLRPAQEDPSLQRLMQAVADLLGVPTALVSVIGADLQFFKARVGLDASTTRREDAFCDHVVAGERAMVVEDTWSDPRFSANPLVTGEPHIRFYAGVPLRLNDQAVGAVCVIDLQPRQLSPSQLAVLELLSQHISQYLQLVREHQQLQQEHSLMDHSPAVLLKWRYVRGLQLMYVSANIQRIFGLPFDLLQTQQRRFEDYLTHASLVEFNFALQNHHAGVAHSEVNLQLQAPKGQSFWVKFSSQAFFSEDGKLETIHALVTDHSQDRYMEQKMLETNQQMRLLLDASGLGTWDWHLASDTSKVNRRWCDMLGLDFELYDSSSRFWQGLIHPADQQQVQRQLQQHLSGESAVFSTSYRLRHAAGHWVWVETYGKVVERAADGTPLRLAGTHRDVTYRKEAELQDQKQRQLLSFINKAQTAYLQHRDLSSACREILPELTDIADSQFAFIGHMQRVDGQPRLLIRAITELAWNEQSQQLVQQYQQGALYFDRFDNLFGQVITTAQVVLSNEPHLHPAAKGTPAGHPRIFRFLGLPIMLQQQLVGMIGIANKLGPYTSADAQFLQPLCTALAGLFYAVEQAEARNKAEAQLQHMALQDPHTGLPNRRAFVQHCSTLQPSDLGYVLAIIEIDHWPSLAATLDETVADAVLLDVAKRLQKAVRASDLLARLGESEFALLLQHTEIDMANLLLEALLLAVASQPLMHAAQPMAISVSIGARYVTPSEDADLTLHMGQADAALETAKNNGHNCLIWY